MKIGEKLKEEREKNKLSQKDVADRLHVVRQSVSRWETDQSYPDLENLMALGQLYHVSIDELLGIEREEVIPESAEKNSRRGRGQTCKKSRVGLERARHGFCLCSCVLFVSSVGGVRSGSAFLEILEKESGGIVKNTACYVYSGQHIQLCCLDTSNIF